MIDRAKKNFLSLTIDQLSHISSEDILVMLKSSIKDMELFGSEYATSMATSIINKLFLLKKKTSRYKIFYEIITSDEFRNNKYLNKAIKQNKIKNLYDLLLEYEHNAELIDATFSNNEKLFDELVSGDYDLKYIFSEDVINMFTRRSYIKLLSYLLKDISRKKVVRSLFKSKNKKFLYVISKMDDTILMYIDDDTNLFDSVLALMNYNNYRQLLWDYHQKYCHNQDKKVKEEKNNFEEVTKELINYTFGLMNIKHSKGRVPIIASNISDLLKRLNQGKDLVHVSVFGMEGYKKVKNNIFDPKFDLMEVDDENRLLNLKIAFFSTIYGITYNQAEKIIKEFNKKMKGSMAIIDEDNLIYETIMAMCSLYNLTINDREKIKLYQKSYYKYIKKNGIYACVKLEAANIIEELLKKMYTNSIEIL